VHKGTHDGYAPYGVQVLGLLGGRIARITAFNDPGLVPTFDVFTARQGSS
jgi:RNA polymerase sigma-70 factor, ECF subfamily